MENNFYPQINNPFYKGKSNYRKKQEKKLHHSKSQPNIYSNMNNNNFNNENSNIYKYDNTPNFPLIKSPSIKNLELHKKMLSHNYDDIDQETSNYLEKYNYYQLNNERDLNNFVNHLNKEFSDNINQQNKKIMNEINQIKNEYNEMKEDLRFRFDNYVKNQNKLYNILQFYIKSKIKNEIENNYNDIRKITEFQNVQDIIKKQINDFENERKLNKLYLLKKKNKNFKERQIIPLNNNNSYFNYQNRKEADYNCPNVNDSNINFPNINIYDYNYPNVNNRKNNLNEEEKNVNRNSSKNIEELNELIIAKKKKNQEKIYNNKNKKYLIDSPENNFKNPFRNSLNKNFKPKKKKIHKKRRYSQ